MSPELLGFRDLDTRLSAGFRNLNGEIRNRLLLFGLWRRYFLGIEIFDATFLADFLRKRLVLAVGNYWENGIGRYLWITNST
ncbi:hypothetical protein RhiirA4_483196 [Rhizophagus irregularis]|uniref:Uncharacterized protein n=1 Tax=Rhizophagus irregularis TaxID=588596 RepID=A0A2I1HLE7_9GLOM|nr:hypothetical protein RhiirA4_482681 [Rhizophagus irregularis]PKY59992.1 hypothetical protein RhiirA4_483196 [Rhizophagus irregularis]